MDLARLAVVCAETAVGARGQSLDHPTLAFQRTRSVHKKGLPSGDCLAVKKAAKSNWPLVSLPLNDVQLVVLCADPFKSGFIEATSAQQRRNRTTTKTQKQQDYACD